jgi:hypothetical protein
MKLALCAMLLTAGVFGVSLLVQQSIREGGGSGAQQEPGRVPPFRALECLTDDDPLDRGRPGRFCRPHQVRLKAGQVCTVELHSTDFDAYLRIEDAAGITLAEDDDSGPNLDARIVFRPAQTGTYTIVVTTFNSGETGWYALNVR